MGFRRDEEARVHRIATLEETLEAKETEIATLRAQLATKEAPPKPEAKGAAGAKHAAYAVPKEADVPQQNVWAFDTHDHKYMWIGGAIWVVAFCALAVYMFFFVTKGLESLAPLLFVPLSLFLFHRSGLVLDKAAGTVTRWDSFLFIRWKRVRAFAGKSVEVERRLVTPKEGDSYWSGHVFLGDLKLFAKKELQAERLARRVAAFLALPYRPKHLDTKAIERQAMMPLLLTIVLTALFLVGYFLSELIGGAG